MKSAYWSTIEASSTPSCRWRLIRNLQVPPKLKLFTWLFCQSKLLTNVNRMSRHMTSDPCCIHCPNQPEFLKPCCTYSGTVPRPIKFGCPLVPPQLFKELFLLFGIIGWQQISCRETASSWALTGTNSSSLFVGPFGNGAISVFLILASVILIMLAVPFYCTFLNGSWLLLRIMMNLLIVPASLAGRCLLLDSLS